MKHLSPVSINNLYIVKGMEAQQFYGNIIEEGPSIVCYITIDPDYNPKQSLLDYRNINTIHLKEYTLTKQFYEPIYDTKEKKQSQVPDLRKTIHWEPQVKLDSNGEATITYYNADRYTHIKCILQGICSEGIPIYGETNYNVVIQKE